MKNMIIELKVRNHPGVMPHIVGLFSRKAINPDAIFYKQIKKSNSSKIYLVMNNDFKTEQILKQLNKLHDITDISINSRFIDYLRKGLYFFR